MQKEQLIENPNRRRCLILANSLKQSQTLSCEYMIALKKLIELLAQFETLEICYYRQNVKKVAEQLSQLSYPTFTVLDCGHHPALLQPKPCPIGR